MRKTVLFSAIILAFALLSTAKAHPFVPEPACHYPAIQQGQHIKKEQAKRVIRRTAGVIFVAHKKVKEGGVYTGNLAKAIAHQKYARRLYRAGKFFRAIHHSRRARQLAVLAIRANKGAESPDMRTSKDEEEIMKGAPSDAELDTELQKEMPNESMKDEEVINQHPDVDLKEDD